MIRWGQAPEFVEKKFRRSKSLHTKRYYENGIRRFRQYCEEKHVDEVDEESVYGVLDGFVGWLDLQGIKPKTLTGYTTTFNMTFVLVPGTYKPMNVTLDVAVATWRKSQAEKDLRP